MAAVASAAAAVEAAEAAAAADTAVVHHPHHRRLSVWTERRRAPPQHSTAIVVADARYLPSSQTCPLLLRVFPRLGAHHHADDFPPDGPLPKDEFQARCEAARKSNPTGTLPRDVSRPAHAPPQIYTWPDATLGELASLVRVRSFSALAHDSRSC